MSEWATIDKLGTAGMVPDKPSDHMQPSELDLAVNVRAIGPNLTNAGGFAEIAAFGEPEPPEPPEEYPEAFLVTTVSIKVEDSPHEYVTAYWNNLDRTWGKKWYFYYTDPYGPSTHFPTPDVPLRPNTFYMGWTGLGGATIEGMDRSSFDDKSFMPLIGYKSGASDGKHAYLCVYNGRRYFTNTTWAELYHFDAFTFGQATFLIPDGHLAAKVFIVNTESTTGSTDGLVLRVRSERRTFDEDGNCEEGRSTTPPPIIYSLSLTEWPVPDRYTYLRIDYPPSNGIEHKINASLFGDFIVSDLYKKFALIVRDRENAGQYVSLEWQIVDGSVVGPAISDILTSNTLEYDLAETSGSIRERITTVLDAGYNAQGVLTFVKVDTDCLVEYSESGNIRENTRTHKVRMYGPGFDESAENTSYMTRDLATQDREYSARTYTTILLIGANYSLERFHIARSVLEIEAHTEDNYDYVDKDHGIRLDELAPIDGPALITGTTDVLRIDRGVETIETTGNCTTSSWYEYSQNLDFNSYAEDPLRGEISRSDVDIVQITEDREEGNTLFGMGHPQFTNPQGFETDAGWESIIFEDYAGAVVEYVPYHLNPNDWDHTGKFMYFQYFDPDGTPYDMSIVEDALWSGPPPSQDSLRNMPTYTVGLEYRAP